MQSRILQRKTLRVSQEVKATLQSYGKFLHTSAVLCSSFDHEYLHRSRIPTYHFQNSLPRLPVPELEKSCQRYLNAQLPLVSEAEHKELQKVVAEFQAGKGQELHKQLVATDKENKHTNYVSDLWFDMYLKDRRPIVLTHNPFVTFTDDPRPEYNTQLIRSANMLISSVRCMKTLRDEMLEPEVFHLNPAKSDTNTFRTVTRLLPSSVSWYGAYLFKAFPLDMSQYKRLFNSCRIPRPERDELYTDKHAKHVLVMRKGNCYVFDVLNKDGNIIPEEEILAHLQYILSDTTPGPEFSVSTLTSDFRDPWTQARQQLLEADPANEQKLRAIEGAMFGVCLDDDQPTDPNEITRSFLCGDGINRWYDKSFQLVFPKSGMAACHFEHSWGDGVAVLRYIREVFKDSTENACIHPETRAAPNAGSSEKVKRLDFTLTPQLKDTITKAKQRFDEATGSLDMHHLQYFKMTKKDLKKTKLSPDSVMQLVIQLAHYKLYHKNRGTYESCSTSAFKHGRTETVRSCTAATAAMCEKMYGQTGSKSSVAELMDGLRACSNTHGQLTKEAAMGHGFDRHLFCLKNLAEKEGMSLPMFTHPAYAHLNHIILSTSTLTDPAVVMGGFAAVTPDGFGVGYGITDDHIGFNVTTYPACNVRDFISCCEKALDDIHTVIQAASKS
ncbi:carnitine o-palmitoyltransferase 2, mitochondrial [Plakobranchus ocellatus]|uniref:Carnitine o-palmitoyltransferase 2, mitochondrial n=1 Tax=Plakobranchus ocellatus TaxID=259542 RepID=A0AAV4BJL0_9GAST|nr:carnitine o-palmitoyltransferase 2, mitochondrial [Plakobranchus ocellatus]